MSQDIEKSLRWELDAKLRELLPDNWHLYFQPPGERGLDYPCLVYAKSSGDTAYANNKDYMYHRRYELTFIYDDPDDETPRNVMRQLDYCRADRHFVTANLNHDTCVLYY